MARRRWGRSSVVKGLSKWFNSQNGWARERKNPSVGEGVSLSIRRREGTEGITSHRWDVIKSVRFLGGGSPWT